MKAPRGLSRRTFFKALSASAIVVGGAALSIPQAVHATLITQSGPRYYASSEGSGFVPLRTRYASETGSSSNDGTSWAQAWTLIHAVSQLQPGDLLLVDDGDYTDTTQSTWQQGFNTANSGTAENPIVIRARNFHGATIHSHTVNVTGGQDHHPAIGIHQRNYVIWDGFIADGMCKIRGLVNGESDYTYVIGSGFVGIDVVRGDYEGTDGSLNWNMAFQFCDGCFARDFRLAGAVIPTTAVENNNYTGDNSACLDIYVSRNLLIENFHIDATNVHSGIGLKAGECNDNTVRNGTIINCRSGIGGEGGTGIFMKANTAATTFCDRNEFSNIVIDDAYEAIFFNHNCRESKFHNITAINCDRFVKQWQLNSVDSEFWNNLHLDTAPYARYFMEIVSGGSPDFGPYIAYSDYNCWVGGVTTFARWQDGTQSMSLSAWQAGQTGITGQDDNSINPADTTGLLENIAGGDYRPASGSPLLGTGRAGTNIGADGTNNTYRWPAEYGTASVRPAKDGYFREALAA